MLRPFFFIFFLLGMSPAKAEPPITLSNGEWRPFLSETLPNHGPISHLVSQAFRVEGVQVKYVFHAWKRAYEEAKRGLVDGSVVWIKSPERRPFFHYSDPVLFEETVLVIHKERPLNVKNPKALSGVEIAGSLGYSYADVLKVYPHMRILKRGTDLSNLKRLAMKRVVGALFHKRTFQTLAQEHLSPSVYHSLRSYTLSKVGLHLIMKKTEKNARLIQLFNRGLETLKGNGTYAELIRKTYE